VCSSVDTCGACDNNCAEDNRGDRCVDGECFCSGAGVACTGTTWCTELTEPPGESCGCADLNTDPNNCQACGIVCTPGDCEEGSCEEDGCHVRTLDADDDGYCLEGCNDNHTGEGRGECRHGDCDDSNPDIHPEQDELCATAFDDDCDGDTNDSGAIGCSDYMRDADGDNYGVTTDTRCLCSPEGDYTATTGGDCNDGQANANPGETDDDCNGYDDDCDPATDDGDTNCANYCCGGSCQECCNDWQCPGAEPDCSGSYTCGCQSGWTNCGGTCNCNTSGSERCCGDTCTTGNCCSSGDCGAGDWTCSSYNCSCAGVNCGGTCYAGGDCCGDGDCVSPALCNLATHLCG
jgi:hypothetical protein